MTDFVSAYKKCFHNTLEKEAAFSLARLAAVGAKAAPRIKLPSSALKTVSQATKTPQAPAIITKSRVPSQLQGLVRPEDAVKQFNSLVSGYRKGIGEHVAMQTGKLYGHGQPAARAHSKGFLTHDSASGGGLAAMDDILRSGKISPSTGNRAQYTRPGLADVYWHRGQPGLEWSRSLGSNPNKKQVSKMWFRGDNAEGIHANLGKLHQEGRILRDAPNINHGAFDYSIARTAGPYQLRAGDHAILASHRRKNLPTLISQTKDHGMNWASTGMQQEALRAAQLEQNMLSRGMLTKGQTIRDATPEMFEKIRRTAGRLPRNFSWWSSANPITDSRLQQQFLKNLRAPY